MSEPAWQGVYAVLVTPFHADHRLDFESLERQVNFCLECSVHGIVAPAIAGEFFTLSDSERLLLMREVATYIDGRVPFVAGVSGVSGPHAAELARAATDAGADALIAMPPYVAPETPETTFKYYRAIAKASPLPLVVQNAPAPFSSPLATEQLIELLEEIPTVRVIKEETFPNPQKLGRLVQAAGSRLKGVFGGLGGIYLFNELSRGASGTMPACQFADVVVDILALIKTKEHRAARERFMALQSALVMERLYNVTFMKRCLVRRGVIATTTTRVPEPPMDRDDEYELDALWEFLSPFFRWSNS